MKRFNITDKNGIKLNTGNTYVDDDINVSLIDSDIINLVAENIKKDVTLLGVIGTYEGDTEKEDGLVTRTLTTYSNNRVTSVGYYAFYYSKNLISVDFPNVTTLDECSFGHCNKLTNVNFPLVTSIGIQAFYYCQELTSIDFPNLTTIGASAFYQCSKITSVNFPLVKTIGENTFRYCLKLTSIDFPLVTSIGTYAFHNCVKLTSANLPNVTKVESYAFGSCTVLTSIDFPLITSIGDSAFKMCSKLTKVIIRTPSVCTLKGTSAFTDTPIASGTGYIYVPDELVEQYKVATNWTTYVNQIKGLSELPTEG